MLIIIVLALLSFTWYGGQHVPKVLKDNKKMLLGVVAGLVLNMFMVEGLEAGEMDMDNYACGDGSYRIPGNVLPDPGTDLATAYSKRNLAQTKANSGDPAAAIDLVKHQALVVATETATGGYMETEPASEPDGANLLQCADNNYIYKNGLPLPNNIKQKECAKGWKAVGGDVQKDGMGHKVLQYTCE